jgi:hypothetical protein
MITSIYEIRRSEKFFVITKEESIPTPSTPPSAQLWHAVRGGGVGKRHRKQGPPLWL